jgi:hypothetical protein
MLSSRGRDQIETEWLDEVDVYDPSPVSIRDASIASGAQYALGNRSRRHGSGRFAPSRDCPFALRRIGGSSSFSIPIYTIEGGFHHNSRGEGEEFGR